jgi:hypothetical protein
MNPAPSPPPAIPTRIVLGQTASAALTASGERAFLVVTRGSYPEADGRWVLHILPATIDQVNGATRIIKGTHKAVKVKAKA